MHLLIDNINNYNENNYQDMIKLIEKEKVAKINKIKNEKAKKQSILGEYLLIKLLKDFYKIDYQKLTFYTNSNGKRYINNKKIYFNISHKNNYVTTVISKKEIGIDIEEVKDIDTKIIKKITTTHEEKYISEDKNKKNERFIEVYTLKEAYIKMLGENISKIKDYDFNKIYSNKEIRIKVDKNINNYIITICEKK